MARRVRDRAFAEFLDRCRAAVSAFSGTNPAAPAAEHIILLYRILALLRSEWITPDQLACAADGLQHTSDLAYNRTHLPIFSNCYNTSVSTETLQDGLDALLGTGGERLSELYFTSIPIGWFGRVYQALIGHAQRKKAGVYFTPDYLVRYVVESCVETLLDGPNGQRTLFETPELIEGIRIIDPAMGSGDFLVQAVETLAGRLQEMGDGGRGSGVGGQEVTGGEGKVTSGRLPVTSGEACHPAATLCHPERSEGSDDTVSETPTSNTQHPTPAARVAAACVFGLDLDPIAVEIARTSVALLVGLDEGPFDSLVRNLRVGDTLLGCISALDGSEEGEPWPVCFPDVCGEVRDPPGFDIVLGNPPYVAAKNGHLNGSYGKLGQTGQSDSYLMFVKHVAESGLLKLGGVFSMVLPDPLLARGNAKDIREILFNRWTPVSLLHIAGAFREAIVANAIPVCRNARLSSRSFRAARISFLSDRFAFASAPHDVFRRKSFEVDRDLMDVQPGREVLYLADADFRRNVLSRIHGSKCSVSEYLPPFAPLAEAGVEKVFRGEEIGKAAVPDDPTDGGYPILLGGQSIARYRIKWEGARISRISKPLDWYLGHKIVVQKSAARIVAAFDECEGEHRGFVAPQSVYCIKPGDLDPFYLLALLNSGLMTDYVYRMFTGYKMFQPQIELEDVKRLPIRLVEYKTPDDEKDRLVREGILLLKPALREGWLHEQSLVSFVEQRMNRVPEQDDVLHDLLARFADIMTVHASLIPTHEEERKEYHKRLDAGQRAIDIIVARLYGVPLSYVTTRKGYS